VVEERLAACVHVTPITSVYRWRNNLEETKEWSCLMKTTGERLPALLSRVSELHSYQVPEILALPVLTGNSRYLQWMADSVRDS
jgi:periplasmic divalent cation tolerance protein